MEGAVVGSVALQADPVFDFLGAGPVFRTRDGDAGHRTVLGVVLKSVLADVAVLGVPVEPGAIERTQVPNVEASQVATRLVVGPIPRLATGTLVLESVDDRVTTC